MYWGVALMFWLLPTFFGVLLRFFRRFQDVFGSIVLMPYRIIPLNRANLWDTMNKT